MADREIVLPNSRQVLLELLALFLCLIVVVFQQLTFDLYFVHYTKDRLWLSWIAADFVIILAFLYVLYASHGYSNGPRKISKHEMNVKDAHVIWLTYSLVFSAKVSAFLYTSAGIGEQFDEKSLLNLPTFQLMLGLSALIGFLLIISHSYANPAKDSKSSHFGSMAGKMTFDTIDNVAFLWLIIDEKAKSKVVEHFALYNTIVVLVCANFLLPTLNVYKLRYRKGVPSSMSYRYEKLYLFAYLAITNLPLLICRIFLWPASSTDVAIPVFMVKNVCMTILACRELFLYFSMQSDRDEDDDVDDDEQQQKFYRPISKSGGSRKRQRGGKR